MLVSEIMGWHWVITWDNPEPADSSKLITALGDLGKLTQGTTKTTWMLAPKAGVTPTNIRAAIVANMHSTNGRVDYVNLRSGKAFGWGAATNYKWRKTI